jgi:hypothetical protein
MIEIISVFVFICILITIFLLNKHSVKRKKMPPHDVFIKDKNINNYEVENYSYNKKKDVYTFELYIELKTIDKRIFEYKRVRTFSIGIPDDPRTFDIIKGMHLSF